MARGSFYAHSASSLVGEGATVTAWMDNEAFLLSVKRIGAMDALTREFAREHPERLWKELALSERQWDDDAGPPRTA